MRERDAKEEKAWGFWMEGKKGGGLDGDFYFFFFKGEFNFDL